MTKRSLILFAAFGLLASLSFATPSHAGAQFIITGESIASDTVTVTPGPGGGSGSFSAALATPLPSPTYTTPTTDSTTLLGSYTATGTGNIASGQYALFQGTLTYDVTIKDVASGMSQTVAIAASFNGVVYTGSSALTPTGVTMTSNPVVIGANQYTLTGSETITSTGSSTSKIYLDFTAQAVPEPTSMALLGIGMAGFLSFRRLFKRKASL